MDGNKKQTSSLQLIMVKYDIQNHSTFTGKERDEETGYSYFGARYMDYELMTMWLSVDPMADKYPGISPYAYCAWNPVKLLDPDGREMFPTESAAAKVRANAVDMFGESRVGEIYNKGDEKHPNYAFLVYDYGKDKYERPHPKEYGHINQLNVLTLNSICFYMQHLKPRKNGPLMGHSL